MIGLVGLGSGYLRRWLARPGDAVGFDPGNGSLAVGTIVEVYRATAQYVVRDNRHGSFFILDAEDVVWRKASRP